MKVGLILIFAYFCLTDCVLRLRVYKNLHDVHKKKGIEIFRIYIFYKNIEKFDELSRSTCKRQSLLVRIKQLLAVKYSKRETEWYKMYFNFVIIS